MRLSARYIASGAAIGLFLLLSYFYTLPDGRLHIVFCDVGQGDAIYINTPANKDMLIDGGPDDSVLVCLGKHMPFYDRTIDVAVLSHPQKDHLYGFISVLQRYRVKYIVIGIEGNDTKEYKALKKIIQEKKIVVKNLYAGDEFFLGQVKAKILWPQKQWVAMRVEGLDPPGVLDNRVLGFSTNQDINLFSPYILVSLGNFKALFTGDGGKDIQSEVGKSNNLLSANLLKVPHHGSKTALLPEFLQKVQPQIAIISVGKNSYGHPAAETLKLLQDTGVIIRRTDREGDIEIISDGN